MDPYLESLDEIPYQEFVLEILSMQFDILYQHFHEVKIFEGIGWFFYRHLFFVYQLVRLRHRHYQQQDLLEENEDERNTCQIHFETDALSGLQMSKKINVSIDILYIDFELLQHFMVPRVFPAENSTLWFKKWAYL